MGVSGSVAYMFDATAVIGLEGKTADEVLEILMEADVDARDILEEEDAVIVYADPDQFHAPLLLQMGLCEIKEKRHEKIPE